MTFNGVTDEVKGLRPLVWRILLNYLPSDSSMWDDTLRANKEMYALWLDELIVKPKLRDEEERKEKEKEASGGIK